MRNNFTQLYVHLVWATWDRLPLITPEIQEPIYNIITFECKQLGCHVIAIGGITDHVHLLTGFPATLAIATLAKQIKGSSSHTINYQIRPNDFFKWQGSYAAFTVNHQDLAPIAAYIHNQADHHQQQTYIPSWEIPLQTTQNK